MHRKVKINCNYNDCDKRKMKYFWREVEEREIMGIFQGQRKRVAEEDSGKKERSFKRRFLFNCKVLVINVIVME